ncbi:MAG: J domain-containing protein [Planctomycetes bacterium]|nr:J domain-containing protein [Planctomycetota bacterium]
MTPDEARTILGLGTNATAAEIKDSVHRLAFKYHPDRHVGAASDLVDLAQQQFVRIQEAGELLTNVLTGSAAENEAEQAEAHFREIEQGIDAAELARDWETAFRLAGEYLQYQPHNTRGLLARVHSAIQLQDWDSAIGAANALMSSNQRAALVYLGRAYEGKGIWSLAERSYRGAQKLHIGLPEETAILCRLALSLLVQCQTQFSQQQLDEADRITDRVALTADREILAALRQRIETLQNEQLLLQSTANQSACPRCGFNYAFRNGPCGHCNYPSTGQAPSATSQEADAEREDASGSGRFLGVFILGALVLLLVLVFFALHVIGNFNNRVHETQQQWEKETTPQVIPENQLPSTPEPTDDHWRQARAEGRIESIRVEYVFYEPVVRGEKNAALATTFNARREEEKDNLKQQGYQFRKRTQETFLKRTSSSDEPDYRHEVVEIWERVKPKN